MLPKVATHILHTTSRAAASIQHQSHTIRNVFQLQSSSGPSSGTGNLAPWSGPSSSNWGNNGPGTGGAKYNAGSRFQNGYTVSSMYIVVLPLFISCRTHFQGPARTLTQANSTISSSHDGSFSQTDDAEELPKCVSISTTNSTRIRSRSLSIPVQGRRERAERLGVLQTVQLHSRSRHAFTSNLPTERSAAALSESHRPPSIQPGSPIISSDSSSASVPSSSASLHSDGSFPPTPVLVRRNSTSASSHRIPDAVELPPLSSSPTPLVSSFAPSDPTVPQTTEAPALHDSSQTLSEAYVCLRDARNSGDASVAAEAVRRFREAAVTPSAREYNMALEALHHTRRPGEPLHMLLETYNAMLKHGLLPNLRTYTLLIYALADRDLEIQKLIHVLGMRLKHRKLAGRDEAVTEQADRQRIESLRREDNFTSAMSLFQAVLSLNGNQRCPPNLYQTLLRSCAHHGSIDNAIHIFAQFEKRPVGRPTALMYKYLIQAYTNAGEIGGAEEIFNDFMTACKRGAIEWNISKNPDLPRRLHLQLWNQMIETYFRCGMPDKAVELVDKMMRSTAGPVFQLGDIPPPATSTFTTVLSGFCQMGDVATAQAWFERLLEQTQANDNPFESSGTAMRPDGVAWSVMLDALAVKGMVKELNRFFSLFLQEADRCGLNVTPTQRAIVFAANMARIEDLDVEQMVQTLGFLMEHTVMESSGSRSDRAAMNTEIWEAYLSKGLYDHAVTVLVRFVHAEIKKEGPHADDLSPADILDILQRMQLEFTRQIYDKTGGAVPFAVIMQLARVADTVRVMQQEEYTPLFLHSYALSQKSDTLPLKDMNSRDWELILYAAVEVETAAKEGRPLHAHIPQYAFGGIFSLLRDMCRQKVALDQMPANLVRRTVNLLIHQYGAEEVKRIFETLGSPYQGLLDGPDQRSSAIARALEESSPTLIQDPNQPLAELPQLRIDQYQTLLVEEALKSNGEHAAVQAYDRFCNGLRAGKAPSSLTIGRMIQGLGRVGEVGKVSYAYTVAQRVLRLLKHNKSWQAAAWFAIEDSMIIALAHHGDVDSAHVHRTRILDHGGALTPDAYGALILNIKDTTDDASNAMSLFQESQVRGVVPNQFLYNNIISKLAKARKADHALELFQQMKSSRIQPSSITYGAVIGACARVGDIHSAELLFSEMVQARNFKPRVPPYNTMMQMYTATKPNRERALHFYRELQKAGVAPTAHTYKVGLSL
jgi:pentatricopeptide repeat protein